MFFLYIHCKHHLYRADTKAHKLTDSVKSDEEKGEDYGFPLNYV